MNDRKTSVRGQGFLRRELVPDEHFDLRRRTGLAMWLTAAGAALFQRLVIGYDFSYALIALPFAFAAVTAFVYPRLGRRAFLIVEQVVMLGCWATVAWAVSVTGGVESGLHVYVMYSMVYAAYFFQSRPLLIVQLVLGSVTAALPLLYDLADVSGSGFLSLLLVLIPSFWVTAALVHLRRRKLDRAELRTRRLSLTDPLTDVANLRAIECFARAELDAGREIALVVADLEGLKAANTTLGHTAGDAMICGLAEVLLTASSKDDQVARIGGDEFAVLLADGSQERIARWERDYARETQAYNERVVGSRPQVFARYGIASSADGHSWAELRASADIRMHEDGRAAGRDRFDLTRARLTEGGRRFVGPEPRPPRERMSEAANRVAGWSWAAAAVLLASTATFSGSPGFDRGVVLTALACFGFSVIAFVGNRFAPRSTFRFTEVAAIGVIAPGMLLTGGHESPILPIGFLIVAFFANFYGLVGSSLRIAAVIAAFSAAFWLDGPVGTDGRMLFVAMLTCAVAIAATLIYNSARLDRAERRWEELALTDALTGVGNRRAFERAAELAIADAESTPDDQRLRRPSIVLVDLDDFKEINAICGHRGGDAALRAIAGQLQAGVDLTGSVFRIGGDEFAVLLEAETPAEVEAVSERCRRAVKRAAVEARHSGAIDARVSACFGYALWRPGLDLRSLIEEADRALTESKETGKDTVSPAPLMRAV